MATVLGTNSYWPSTAANTQTMRQAQKQEMGQINNNGSLASSNSSASSLTAFNFDDSGVGTEEHAVGTTMLTLESGTSPPFYALQQNQPLPHFNNLYQQQSYQQHFPDENTIGNNNGPIFKDLDGSKVEHMPIPICSCCQQAITDRFILKVHPNLEFHASCLKCVDCQRILDENCTVFLRNGQTYCKEDYARLFNRRCQRCDQQFNMEEMVMRARNSAYHLDCFTCVTCNRKLGIGEQFVVNGNELYCQAPECFRPIKTEPHTWDAPINPIKNRLSMDTDSRMTPLVLKAEVNEEVMLASSSQIQPINYCNTANLANVPPLHQSSMSSNSSTSSISGRHSISVGTSSGGRKSKKDKPTQRIRTVLTEQQLKILKHMYTINQRPDATTKESLVQQTGLSQRVIRVWFQNKRCKESLPYPPLDKKKQNLAVEQEQNLEREQAIHGIRTSGVGPIVALSPTSLQDTGLMNPIDIRQFPQNPSLWSNVCDTPPNNNPVSLADLSYSSTMMMNNVASSYPQEMTTMSPDYGTARYGIPDTYNNPSMGLTIPLANNGLPNSSLSSSPSFSD